MFRGEQVISSLAAIVLLHTGMPPCTSCTQNPGRVWKQLCRAGSGIRFEMQLAVALHILGWLFAGLGCQCCWMLQMYCRWLWLRCLLTTPVLLHVRSCMLLYTSFLQDLGGSAAGCCRQPAGDPVTVPACRRQLRATRVKAEGAAGPAVQGLCCADQVGVRV